MSGLTTENTEGTEGSKIWIIDLEAFGMSEGTKEARGPFRSMAAAEKWLKTDAAENFQSLNEPEQLGPNDEWAAPVLIVEQKKKLRQVPVVNFQIRLEEVE